MSVKKEDHMKNKSRESGNKTRIIDGITECCGYDFGIEGYFNKQIRYCPICGKEIIEKN